MRTAADRIATGQRRSPLDRRSFFKRIVAAAVLTRFAEKTHAASKPGAASKTLIDVNVNLSRWPLRRVRFDDTAALVGKLRENGVVQAWAGSFDGLLHKDIRAVNARLVEQCRLHGRGLLVPFGSINPMLPDWKEDLRRCVEEHRMPGLRLHPNYHGYKLDSPVFGQLLQIASERRLIVQLAPIMEDERMMHPLLHIPPADTALLSDLVRKLPSLRIVLLNALGMLRGKPLLDLISAGKVYVEISMLEGLGGIGNLLGSAPFDRLLFGSYAPLFYFESAVFKLRESLLTTEQLEAISAGNARRLMAERP